MSQLTFPASYYDEYTIAFEGSSVACVLYGVYLVVVGRNIFLLNRKRYNVLLSFTLLQLVVTTLYVAISLFSAPAQLLAIFGLYGTFGPDALSPWPAVVVDAAFVVNTWTSDAFLLYRCYAVCLGNKYAMAFPVLLYISTFGSSLAYLYTSSNPGAVYSTTAVQISGICYWSFTAATNVFASCLITVRLWLHRQAISRAVGSGQGEFYLGYMAMTLESALLYTIFAIIALVVFAVNSQLENVFFPVLGMAQVIAPALIVYRIASGISFETDQRGSYPTASLRFAKSTQPHGVMRSVQQEVSGGSQTIHGSYGERSKFGRDDSTSVIHELKSAV